MLKTNNSAYDFDCYENIEWNVLKIRQFHKDTTLSDFSWVALTITTYIIESDTGRRMTVFM